MGIVDTVKETVGLIQKVDNIELYRKMLDLQTQVVSLVDENRELRERLATREKLSFKNNAYWIGDDGPFCSPCWDTNEKLVHLHRRPGFHPQCPSCRQPSVDPDVSPPRPIRRVVRSSFWDRRYPQF